MDEMFGKHEILTGFPRLVTHTHTKYENTNIFIY